ncbi:MAG: hypothetical protein QM750_15080 [Rubrivivax sp.]
MATPDFTKMVPGFDFLQGLMKGAGSALPGMSQWIAPTLDAEEVNKRIQELRTVQFWLEQNAKMLGATIQALEVQRMSLATLQALNLPMSDLGDALKLGARRASPPREVPQEAPKAEAPAPEPAPRPARKKADAGAAPAAAPGMVDPLQWWGALTRQFTELAANAVKDTPAEGFTQMAGAAFKQAVQPMADAAGAVAKAVKAPAARKAGAAKPAAKTAKARR